MSAAVVEPCKFEAVDLLIKALDAPQNGIAAPTVTNPVIPNDFGSELVDPTLTRSIVRDPTVIPGRGQERLALTGTQAGKERRQTGRLIDRRQTSENVKTEVEVDRTRGDALRDKPALRVEGL